MAREKKRLPQSAGVRKRSDARVVEWICGLVSAVIVVAMIGWVAWEALTETQTLPAFAVTVTGREAVEGGYRVSFKIANTASRTAAAVVVRGEIVDRETVVEEADITFDYVPGQSSASGTFLFSQNPGTRPLHVRAIGYTQP